MPLDPDTEIQYRKGGKVKQKPKKFASGGFMNWVLGKKEEPKKAEPKEEPKEPPKEKEKFQGILKQGDTLSNPFKKMIENAGNPPPEKKAKGGPVKESKAMIGKELSFMKKKGAPKSMIKHEAAEMGAMKPKKYARGGGIEIKGKTRGKMC